MVAYINAHTHTVLEKVQTLKVLEDRMHHFQLPDALLLLHYSFAASKLIYLLHTSPCFSSPSLHDFDELLRRILNSICNIQTKDKLWMQDSLPVCYNGLDLRSVVHLAPSAFLSAVNAMTLLTALFHQVFTLYPTLK